MWGIFLMFRGQKTSRMLTCLTPLQQFGRFYQIVNVVHYYYSKGKLLKQTKGWRRNAKQLPSLTLLIALTVTGEFIDTVYNSENWYPHCAHTKNRRLRFPTKRKAKRGTCRLPLQIYKFFFSLYFIYIITMPHLHTPPYTHLQYILLLQGLQISIR